MRFAITLLLFLFGGLVSADLITPDAVRSSLINKLLIKNTGEKSTKVRNEVFNQLVDHTNPNAGYFYQRVFIHDAHYQVGGPVFVFISAYNAEYEYWLENSGITDIAAANGGVIYAFEPRYYGESRPTSDLSIENLSRYLTISQIQADFTAIITYLRTSLAEYGSEDFVLYGYDTGASIATWIHNSNPGLVNGVVAIGSLQIAVFDFKTYYYYAYQTLMANVRQTGTCVDRLLGANEEIDYLLETGNGAELQRLFNLYEPVDTSDPVERGTFWNSYLSILSVLIEYGDQSQLDWLCDIIEEVPDASNIESVAHAFSVLFGGQVLHLSFAESVRIYSEENWDSDGVILGGRQQYFMACNEWSWFRTSIMLSEPVTHEFDEDMFVHACQQVFGTQFTRDTIFVANMRTNDNNRLSHDIRNVYFTNGEWDPFRIVSQPRDLNEDAPSDIIAGVGKAFDLPRISENDSDSVRAAKERQRDLVLQWIQ